jgi:hypothetical protein
MRAKYCRCATEGANTGPGAGTLLSAVQAWARASATGQDTWASVAKVGRMRGLWSRPRSKESTGRVCTMARRHDNAPKYPE